MYRVQRSVKPRNLLLPRINRGTIRVSLICDQSSNTTRRRTYVVGVQLRLKGTFNRTRRVKRMILRLVTGNVVHLHKNVVHPLRLRRTISVFRKRSIFEGCSMSRTNRLVPNVLLFSKITSSPFLGMITRRKDNRLRPLGYTRAPISGLCALVRVGPCNKRFYVPKRNGPYNTNHGTTI